MPLFEVVIVQNPTAEERTLKSKVEKILVGPVMVVSATAQSAAAIVAAKHATALEGAEPGLILPVVRPFQGTS